MTAIHKGLPNATFTKPEGIVEQTVCRATGCTATTGCTDTYREIFTSDNLPEKCQGHGSQTICSESEKIATEYCAQYVETTTKNYGGVVPKEKLKLWKSVNGGGSIGKDKVEETCPIHTKPKEAESPQTNTENPVGTTNANNQTNATNTTNSINKDNTTNTGNTDNVTNPSNTTGENNTTTNTN